MNERGRSVPEWIGKTPDTKVPPRVRLRVLERHNFTCHLSGRPICAGDKWELEHVKALRDGGENRESNLAPALVEPHKAKTRGERKRGAKADHAGKKHFGIAKLSRPIPGSKRSGWRRKMDGTVERRA